MQECYPRLSRPAKEVLGEEHLERFKKAAGDAVEMMNGPKPRLHRPRRAEVRPEVAAEPPSVLNGTASTWSSAMQSPQ
jgi:hypothetical protein